MVMNDMIDIFNRLTESELSECELFKDILENHYEKYKYFYWQICDIPFDKVQCIICEPSESCILIKIEFKNNKNRDSFKKTMKNNISSFSSDDDENFSLIITTGSNELNISIEDKIDL